MIFSRLINNKLFRLIGICAILYFALFNNKENPNAPGNILTKKNIEKGFEQVTNQTQTIAFGLDQAKKETAIVKQQMQQTAPKNLVPEPKILVEDLENGVGDEILSCQNKAQLSYEILALRDMQLIKKISHEQIVIGSKTNSIIENHVIGMRKEGVRSLKIPADFVTSDIDLTKMLQSNQGLIYKIKLLDFTKTATIDPNLNCN